MVEIKFVVPDAATAERISNAFAKKFPKEEEVTDEEHVRNCVKEWVKRMVKEAEEQIAREAIVVDIEGIIN